MRIITVAAIAACSLAATAHAAAPSYPERPVRLVVPFAAGGTATILARAIANEAERHLDQPIVVDNRGGANGIIGTHLVATAEPDGYTVLHVTTSIAINPSVYRKLPYDTLRDFQPVTFVALGSGYLLLAHPGFAPQSVKDLIVSAKAHRVTYGTAGIGNSTHLVAEMFSRAAGLSMTHVPYKGVAPALNGVMGGEVNVMFIPPTVAVSQVKAGKAKALAFTGKQRWSVLPDVPTVAESGLPGFHKDSGWNVWLVPAKTPAHVVTRLHAAAQRAVNAPKVKALLEAGGYDPFANPPAEARKLLREEIKTYGAIVRAVGIQPE